MNEGSNPEITVHVGTFMEQTETYIHVPSEAFSKNVIVFFSDNEQYFFTSDCASNMHGGISVMWVVLRAG